MKVFQDLSNMVTSNSIKIYVRFSNVRNVKTWQVNLLKKNSIKDLKNNIQDAHGIPVEEQRIFFDDKSGELDNDTELSSYASKTLNLKLSRFSDQVILNVQYKTGDPVPVGMSLHEPLKMARIRIFDKDVPLFKKDGDKQIKLTGAETMAKLGLKDGDTIYADKQQAVADIEPTIKDQLDKLRELVHAKLPTDLSEDDEFHDAQTKFGDGGTPYRTDTSKSSPVAGGSRDSKVVHHDQTRARARSQEPHKDFERKKMKSSDHDYEQLRRLLDELHGELNVKSDGDLMRTVQAQKFLVSQSKGLARDNENSKDMILKYSSRYETMDYSNDRCSGCGSECGGSLEIHQGRSTKTTCEIK